MQKNDKWDLKYAEYLSKLCNIFSMTAKTNEDKELLDFSIDSLNFILSNNSHEKQSTIHDYIKSELKIWNEYKEYLPMLTLTRKYFNDFKDFLCEYKDYNFSLGNIIDIGYDFYTNLDFEFSQLYLDILKDREKVFNLSDRNSCVFFVPYFKKGFINIERSSTIFPVLHLIHETAHLISLKMNPYNIVNEKGKFLETETQFIELLAFDYLATIPEFQDEMKKVKLSGACDNVINAENILIKKNILAKISNIIDNENITYLDIAKEVTKNENVDKDLIITITSMVSNHFSDTIDHTITFPYSISLYELYKSNPEQAMNILKKYILGSHDECKQIFNGLENYLERDMSNYALSLKKEYE